MIVADIIKNHSQQYPRHDIELLLQHTLGIDKSQLITDKNRELSVVDQAMFLAFFERLESGEPLSYIIGQKGFWDCELLVNEYVLIPRPDTELLVELALKKLDDKKLKILELGTGSGAIAIALKKSRPNWNVTASDISVEAIKVAKINAKKNNCDITFIQSNWFAKVPNEKFDLIISNPPYIEENDPHLKQLTYEPKRALVSGKDGLDAIREIIQNAKSFLVPSAYLMLEHGYNQQQAVKQLFEESGYSNINGFKDLSSNDRVVIANFPE